MECLILGKEEITEEECACIIAESYKEKNGKELPKKIKRIIGWKGICKECKYYVPEQKNMKRKRVKDKAPIGKRKTK